MFADVTIVGVHTKQGNPRLTAATADGGVLAQAIAKRSKCADQFDQLSALTLIVADTGDVDAIGKFKPTDATTNPSLIFKAAQMPQYKALLDDAVAKGKAEKGTAEEKLACTLDHLSVNFGTEILKTVPGSLLPC